MKSTAQSFSERAPRLSRDTIVNAFSVDVEDYFQVAAFDDRVARSQWDDFPPRVEANTQRLLELFGQCQVKVTLFVLGWVAERFPELIREIHREGHELAIHGYDHRSVTDLSPTEFRQQIRSTKRLVEDLSGAEVVGFRAPNYSIVNETLWALDILLEEGFRYDSSIFPIHHDRYGIPSGPRFSFVARRGDGRELVEFPVSTVRVAGVNLPFVGGGYLRHFPMWFVRWGLRRINLKEDQPAVVYIHPWEIDADQPRIPAKLSVRIRHYRNLDKAEDRLRSLFGEFQFTTIRRVLGL